MNIAHFQLAAKAAFMIIPCEIFCCFFQPPALQLLSDVLRQLDYQLHLVEPRHCPSHVICHGGAFDTSSLRIYSVSRPWYEVIFEHPYLQTFPKPERLFKRTVESYFYLEFGTVCLSD